MGVPPWAWYAFGACFSLIVLFLLLDYLLIRRNALGNSCCSFTQKKRPPGMVASCPQTNLACDSSHHYHHKRSTNMILSV
ncbi:unnamed protein product [Bursaphelenchus xylophilus]|uniref:(pine wood nematode) hypothetical protein n=1 Tax=Bursaphelenchus xylophilus TaxID=6326 RepID=A0A1I7SS22_BURXY|nr:unnamed protein product [Bursaphelenchus xylophilus]CAG9105775.1 unnamed protein product [Bursaphelenchus xylophilus]